jgi:hypothetical protein
MALVRNVSSRLFVQDADRALPWDDDGASPDNAPGPYLFCLASPGISGQELDQ